MQNGEYRNHAGAVLHVVGQFHGTHRVRTLAGIFEAEARDPLFGVTTYLVTDESLAESGYKLVPTSPDSGRSTDA